MVNLIELLKGNIGKDNTQMVSFFNNMIQSKEAKAYKITREGLNKIEEIEEHIHKSFMFEILQDKNRYIVHITSYGDLVYNDGESQTVYNHCTMHKLTKQFIPKIENTEMISDQDITARFKINYKENWESRDEADYIASTKGNFLIYGEKDELFTKIHEFLKS
ncbi:hypothetical protein J4440_02570 [Candidatus Woesearchaeota archaeon]|nr:hypothetical protein [Candidatus Woesearchaeota archaeon]